MMTLYKYRALGLCGVALLLLFGAMCTPQPTATSGAAPSARKLLPRFPDFGFLPNPGTGKDEYLGRTFRLSQDYPTSKPGIEPAVQKILSIDYTKDWRAYTEAIREYIYEGNIGHPGGGANDFYLEDNKVRRWHHVPWQHYGPFGREGIHGLTKEGPVNPYVLNPAQHAQWQTYAVGFYNAPGGYMIGKVWADASNPDLSVMESEGFPEGTIVGKVLFTTTPVQQAPFLKNPIEWKAYTTLRFQDTTCRDTTCRTYNPRIMNTVRFIQMDFMVRDSRAKATGGWVFGTFAFNGNLGNANPWLNVVPVGIMWGNDSTVTADLTNPRPTRTITNPALKETIINPDSTKLPPAHLGWGLRLDGPVDDTRSSCMSCHSTAQFPAISPILPFLDMVDGKPIPVGGKQWMRWFRNVPCTKPFDTQAVSADYSLQLAASIQNFLLARQAETKGLYDVQYWRGKPIQPILGLRGASPAQQRQETQRLHKAVRSIK